MSASGGRVHPSRVIPFLLIGIMSLLALGAAILAVATGGPPSSGSSLPGTGMARGEVAAVGAPGPAGPTTAAHSVVAAVATGRPWHHPASV